MINLKVPALVTLFVGLMLAGAFWAGTIKGAGNERVKCAEGKTDAIHEEVTSYEKKRKEITTLPIDDLKRRYCKWVRDDMQKCLASDIPVRE